MKLSLLFVHPSFFYYPAGLERSEVKTAQLLMASYLSRSFPVTYGDFELSIGRPETDIQVKRFERRVREYLAGQTYDILAISCWTSLSYQSTMMVARVSRELYPDRLIVVGGYHGTARPQDFCTSEQLIDYVIRGEGEIALQQIAEGLAATGRPAQTTFIDSPALQPEQFVPVNWDLVTDTVREHLPDGVGTLTLYLARGCPFECSFCIEGLKDRAWRPADPEFAVEQLRIAGERFKPVALGIGDACFGVRPEWRKAFLRKLAEWSPPYWFVMETRPEYLDEEDVRLMGSVKTQIQFGLESCSPTMLRIMNKTKTPEKFLQHFRRASRMMSEYGIVQGANLIFNHPGETEQTLRETFAWVDEELAHTNGTLMWACHGYLHFPGSDVDRRQAYYESEFGAQILCGEWWREKGNPFDMAQRIVPSRDLTGDRLRLWKRWFDERDAAFRAAVNDTTFNIAAESYFPHWQSDARYRRVYD